MATNIMIRGLQLEFHTAPRCVVKPHSSVYTNRRQSRLIMPFAEVWLEKNYIREIVAPTPLFFSRMFTVPKKKGEVRPIIDLSALNRLLCIPHFRMETIPKIAKSVTTTMWGTTTDVTDAYLNVPIAHADQVYFAFVLWDYRTQRWRKFLFCVMPFGLSTAPWAFTRIMKPIKVHLHLSGITVFSYLDDFFNLASSPQLVESQTNYTVTLLESLGFSINHGKSQHVPSQLIEYLGVIWNLESLMLSLPETKVQRILSLVRSARQAVTMTRREMESIVGFLSFAADYIPLGRLFLLPIIRWMNRVSSTVHRDVPILLDRTLSTAFAAWADQQALRVPVPMFPPSPTLEIMTDASLFGWSGILLPHRVEGAWPITVWFHSMNWKELKAIWLTVLYFADSLRGQSVRVLSDNTTALACLRRQGSLHSPFLYFLSKEILEFCYDQEITLLPTYLRGALNVIADAGSRNGPISTEWTLDPHSFAEICSWWGVPQVDLFATRFNTQMMTFVSPCPDPAAVGVDAMSIDWNLWWSVYLFPPLQLLPEVVSRLHLFKGEGILIAPFWPAKEWFVPLNQRCPFRLPLPQGHTLFQYTPQGLATCPRVESWNLHAWRL